MSYSAALPQPLTLFRLSQPQVAPHGVPQSSPALSAACASSVSSLASVYEKRAPQGLSCRWELVVGASGAARLQCRWG